jgi:hypothetical protein
MAFRSTTKLWVQTQDRTKWFKRVTRLTLYTTDELLRQHTTKHSTMRSTTAGQKLPSCNSELEIQKDRYIDACVIRTHASEEMSLAGPRVNHSAKAPCWYIKWCVVWSRDIHGFCIFHILHHDNAVIMYRQRCIQKDTFLPHPGMIGSRYDM